jgi:hypothetical protein
MAHRCAPRVPSGHDWPCRHRGLERRGPCARASAWCRILRILLYFRPYAPAAASWAIGGQEDGCGQKKQIERTAEGLDAAKQFPAEFNEAKRRPGRLQAERIRFTEAAARYLVAHKTKRDGTPRMLLSRAGLGPAARSMSRRD